MKREIKFKSYIRNKDTGEIKSVIWIPFPIDHYEGDAGELLGPHEEIIDYALQFTGLKDKNGKEIYEGDIIKDDAPNPLQVSWSNEFASFVLKRNGWMFSHWFGESCDAKDVEVIGNIYENPDLL